MPWLAPAALFFALAQPAAEPGPKVGTLPLAVPDDVSELDQRTLRQRFDDGVTRSGLTAVPVDGADGCADPGCYKAAADGAQVDLLFGGKVERNGPDYVIEVHAIDGGTGEEVASLDGVCEICGVGELGDVVGSMAARLRPTLENATKPTVLSVDSEPDDAEVYLDGEPVGVTPLEIEATAGPHGLDVVKRGRRTKHVELDLRPGVNESFSFRLARSTRVPPWLPWTALGVGVGSLSAGIALLAIDEEPIRRDCNADVDGNCEFLYDTVNGGVVMTVLGVGLIGTGVTLTILQAREDRAQRAGLAARLQLRPGLRGASLVGRF